ncbi:Cc8L18.2-like protein, partial [Daphnia magna]
KKEFYFYFERQCLFASQSNRLSITSLRILGFSFEFVFCKMDISSDKCCVGVVVNSDCFKLHFTKSLDLIVLLDLPPDDQRVIKLRVNSEGVKTICAHHYAIYYDYYDSPRFHYAKNCCDPFKKHKRVVRGIYKINLAFSDKVHGFDNNLRLIPGKTLCPRCSTQLNVLSSEPK